MACATPKDLPFSLAYTASALMHQVLGVSFAATEKQVPHVNTAGFVHVKAVDVAGKRLTLLSPCAGALPGKYLVLGALPWVDV